MKKKLVLTLILAMVLLYAPTVFAVNVNINGCESVLPGAQIDVRIANIVHTIILIIQIAVPVVLVIMGMLDLFKGITAQKEDEIKKGQQMLIKRLITAVLVFFIVAIVKLLISFAAGQGESKNILTCADCFLNGADEISGDCK